MEVFGDIPQLPTLTSAERDAYPSLSDAILFRSGDGHYEGRQDNLPILLNGGSVEAKSANFTAARHARLYVVTTNASTITANLPTGISAGFTVLVRKADTGTGTVVVKSGATTMVTLFQQHDHATLIYDGSTWLVTQAPDVDVRSATWTAGALSLDSLANGGRYKNHRIQLPQFTGGTTENNTIDISNAMIGETFDFFVSRDATAGTKTITFTSAGGRTFRKSWGAGTQAVGVSQFWTFSCICVTSTELWVVSRRHY